MGHTLNPERYPREYFLMLDLRARDEHFSEETEVRSLKDAKHLQSHFSGFRAALRKGSQNPAHDLPTQQEYARLYKLSLRVYTRRKGGKSPSDPVYVIFTSEGSQSSRKIGGFQLSPSHQHQPTQPSTSQPSPLTSVQSLGDQISPAEPEPIRTKQEMVDDDFWQAVVSEQEQFALSEITPRIIEGFGASPDTKQAALEYILDRLSAQLIPTALTYVSSKDAFEHLLSRSPSGEEVAPYRKFFHLLNQHFPEPDFHEKIGSTLPFGTIRALAPILDPPETLPTGNPTLPPSGRNMFDALQG